MEVVEVRGGTVRCRWAAPGGAQEDEFPAAALQSAESPGAQPAEAAPGWRPDEDEDGIDPDGDTPAPWERGADWWKKGGGP